MIGVTKITSAAQAFDYYSERDDYYLSDKSAAEWYGRGAAALGLAGEIDPHEFHDVLAGTYGRAAVKNPARHTPGWDVTFSAPKSVSVAALVNKDERLTAAHDAAVRAALDHIERQAIITRQRNAAGGYDYRSTGSLVAGVVRHSTSRNLDPQLHSHAVIANSTLDPATGKWGSIDSRQGLFSAQIEANNAYMNALADGARRAGYRVAWEVKANGAVCFELAEISTELREHFSTRTAEIDAALAARGLTREDASAAAREAATLDTRSPKEHISGAELHQRWTAQSAALGQPVAERPMAAEAVNPSERAAAADDAIRGGVSHLAERETRFTSRQILAAARTYSQGRADDAELTSALERARAAGDLIERETLQDVPGGERRMVAGFTTRSGEETERAMLAHAAAIAASGHGRSRIGEASRGEDAASRIEAAIAAQEARTGHRFSTEQRAAVSGVLTSDSGLHIVQGFAGTAKTTTVLATVAEEARAGGWTVRAMAPTSSAAATLGEAIGAEGQTVAAAINAKPSAGSADRSEVWIVDEAGMTSAADKRDLLARARSEGARVILVGDDRQIGSVGAGAAFAQIKEAHPESTHELTDIKRQRSDQLRGAVYDALHGRASDALNKVEVREHSTADEAAQAIADDYMRATAGGKETLVVTLSRADREAVNAAIQQRREEAGQVQDVRDVATLQDRQMTEAERRDASRYVVGDVIAAGRDFKNGPKRGELAEVARIEDGKVTAVRADGREWTFEPSKVNRISVAERHQTRIGAGDCIVTKGQIQSEAGDRIKNGTLLVVDRAREDGRIEATDGAGQRHVIDARRGAKVDLAYAQTANQAQGRTVDVVIADMRSSQRKLADQQRTYVSLSRAREQAIVHTDNKARLAAQIEGRTGQKETALARVRSPEPERPQVQTTQATANTRHAIPSPVPARSPDRERGQQTAPESKWRKFTAAAGGAARAMGAAAAEGARRVAADMREHRAKAPRRKFDRDTKKIVRSIDQRAAGQRAATRRGRSVLNPVRHAKVAAINSAASQQKARVRGAQVVAHARWEAADRGAKSEWRDPTAKKILVRTTDGRTARSTDRGRTFTEERGIKGVIDRYQAGRQAAQKEAVERDRREHRMRGGGETANSGELAKRALATHEADQKRLIPPKRDWDAMAARHGVEYDKQGQRYAHDGRGGLHSEALTKREHAMSETAAGQQARARTDGRAAPALRGLGARRDIERTIKSGQQAEIGRLQRLAGDRPAIEPKTTKAKGQAKTARTPAPQPQKQGAKPAGRGAKPATSEPKTTKAKGHDRGGPRWG